VNRSGRILADLEALLDLFDRSCKDTATIRELQDVLKTKAKWVRAHDLFQKIRKKTISAERNNDVLLLAQYRLEEAIAKTIYNLGNFSAPFDSDSPYWVVPAALALARKLLLDDSQVTRIVRPD